MKVRLIPLLLILQIGVFSLINADDNGPYFGNGVHNGWAKPDSVVIWTRLTSQPERNIEGGDWIVVTKEEDQNVLRWMTDEAAIHARQIPEGYTLEEMKGACPGSAGQVRLSYWPQGNKAHSVILDWVNVEEDKNYTRQWKLEGLKPGTRYTLKLDARKDADSAVSDTLMGSVLTAGGEKNVEEVLFTIVTCHDYIRKDHPDGHIIYDSMMKMKPDFFVHTGDIEYYDKPNPWAMTEPLMYFKWDRLFSLPLQRNFWNQTSSYFQKDDHDVLRNDSWPGMTYGSVSWERGVEIFDKEQFPTNDPPYDTIRWSKDLQIWITEGRNYRSANDDPDGPGKTLLGEKQKQWLFRTLKESDATFKVIISANPILGPDRGGKSDNYANSNFKYEGDEIRDFINSMPNVYMANGDRHWQYATHWEDTRLWEFGCGPGADAHASGWKQEDFRPEHRFLRVKGGFLKGTVKRIDSTPTLVFEHCDVEGNVVSTFLFEPEAS